MSDKHWALCAIGGVGDLAVWVDDGALEASGKIEVENVTQVMAGPQGQIGLSKKTERGLVNLDLVALVVRVPNELAAALSKLWDVPGQIVIPDNGERQRFRAL